MVTDPLVTAGPGADFTGHGLTGLLTLLAGEDGDKVESLALKLSSIQFEYLLGLRRQTRHVLLSWHVGVLTLPMGMSTS